MNTMTNRRRFLKRAGVVGIFTVSAGCTGSQQGNGGGSKNDANGGSDGSSGGGGSGGDNGDGGDNANKNETATDGGDNTMMTTGTATGNETGGGVTEVAAGPNGNLVFEPETVEIPLGGTVRWNFKSPGHNVSAKPEVSEEIKLPQGAEPFASYPDGKSYQIVPEGESYSHTFETPGEYVYVCVPHISAGMVGTVKVSK